MGSSSKLNYQIYKYILHLHVDMQNIYSTQWMRKKSYNGVDCLIYGQIYTIYVWRIQKPLDY